MDNLKDRAKLPSSLKFSFFISSYFPLFLIVILRQIEQNINYLSFGGININSINLLFSKFGISIILIFVSIFGFIGLFSFLKDMKNKAETNGHEFVIDNMQNRNTESIGYIATYLLPFVFQRYSSLFDILQMILLLSVMYIVYTHSNLFIVNPLLNLKYSLYEIEYHNIKSPEIKRNGIFIVNCHYLKKCDKIFAYEWYTNLFYGIMEDQNG